MYAGAQKSACQLLVKGGGGGFLLLLFSPGFTVALTHLPPTFSHSFPQCLILQHVRGVTFNSHLKFNQKYFQSALSVHFFITQLLL